MATSTVEDYLKRILLEEQGQGEGLVPMGQLASKLDLAPGTVTAMMKTLADSGLVSYQPYSGVRLTPEGRRLALHVLRRHRLLELFLVRVVGLEWSEVHPEAELLEHAVSERLIARIDELLGHPAVDPHGDPIPNAAGELHQPDFPDLLSCPLLQPLRLARVSDQDPQFLRMLEESGLRPGSQLIIESKDVAADTLAVRVTRDAGSPPANTLSLGFRAASKIHAEPLLSAGAPKRM